LRSQNFKDIQKEYALKYQNEIYLLIKRKEIEYNNQNSQLIDINEKRSKLLPSTFYIHLTREMSSKGYSGYNQFVDFNMKMREEFLKYYVKKRYFSKAEVIEPFFKDNENIFKPKLKLPVSYLYGLFSTLLLAFILFLIALFINLLKLKKQPEISLDKIPDIEFKKGRSYFIYRKKTKDKDNLFHYYAAKGNTAVLDKISPRDIDTGIKPADMFTFYCKTRGTDINYAIDSLKILGIENIYLLKRKNLKENQEEENKGILKKIYMAASLNQNCETIVINDFVKGESRTFEKQFINLLLKMESQKKTILYLGTEPYVSIDWKTQFQDEMPEKEVLINLKEVSFR
jgi:hypothetical protein